MSKENKARMKVYGFLLLIIIVATSIHLLTPSTNASDTDETPAQEQAATEATDPNTPQDDNQETDGEEGDKKDKEDEIPVELHSASTGSISASISATANLRALREVDVAARSDGIVQSLEVEEGDYVKKDQLLCKLDDTQINIRLQSGLQRLAQAKIQSEKSVIRRQKAEAQIKNSKEELRRYEELYANKLVSETEVAQLRYRLEELEHDQRVSQSETVEISHRVEELQAENEQMRLELSRAQVKAPFSGYIIERMVEPGRTVRNLEALFKLADFSPLYADVYLSEAEARRVRPGQSASVSLGVDETVHLSARIVRISPVVDQATGTVKITVEIKESHPSFKPGAFVRVGIQTDTRTDALLIPKQAVLDEDGIKYVYVAEGETASKIEVVLGYNNKQEVEILAGLQSGQKVVIAGQGALKDGSPINVVDMHATDTKLKAENSKHVSK